MVARKNEIREHGKARAISLGSAWRKAPEIRAWLLLAALIYVLWWTARIWSGLGGLVPELHRWWARALAWGGPMMGVYVGSIVRDRADDPDRWPRGVEWRLAFYAPACVTLVGSLWLALVGRGSLVNLVFLGWLAYDVGFIAGFIVLPALSGPSRTSADLGP